MSGDIPVGGHAYRVEPLDIFDQFDIARRLAPIVTLLTMQKDREKLQKGFARAFVSMASGLSREDGQAVLVTCLSRVHRSQSGAYSPACMNGTMMFSDIGLQDSIDLLWHVLVASKIIDFFDVPPSVSKGKGAGAKA